MWRLTGALILTLLLMACVDYTGSVPVRDINTELVGQTLYYVVGPGETLYSVAWRYELDYLQLAQLNGLSAPYAIHPGERLCLSAPPAEKPQEKAALAKPMKQWLWPAKGKIVQGFSSRNKGINIKGNYGESVIATAPGEVVYAGDGIRGYGKLLILKHNRSFLTAYAYNSRLLVKTGDSIKAGQKIAIMGKTSRGQILLHFEVRKLGKPVNPLLYLKG